MPIVYHLIYKNFSVLPLHSSRIDDVVSVEDNITPHTPRMAVLFISSVLIN
nr:MAG TPA: hypothetical protein [Caudoviricetes sp.]